MTESVKAHLDELSSELEDSLGQPPRLGQVLSLLTWGVRSLDPGSISRTDPAAVEAITALTDEGRVSPEAADDANDAAFTEAADLIADLAGELSEELGRTPTLIHLLEPIAEALGVRKLEAAAKRKGKRAREGDIIAIPVGDGRHRLAVALEHNRFGFALGLFKGSYPLTPTVPENLEPERHALHTGEDAVRSGRWPIVGHDDELRTRFNRPEIFHPPSPRLPEIGRHGSGETADGHLRDLDEDEANELGLLDAVFHQVLLEEQLERRLQAEP